MKVFFDESGQTGCVLQNKKGDLYSDNQRFFVLAGVICRDQQTEDLLRKRYQDFLNHFGISAEEFKGTDILTKANNDKLKYFVENLIDDENFYVCCYDKIFYLATMLNMYFLGRDTMISNPLEYYQFASALSREKDDLFKEFCKTIENNNSKTRRKFVEYIVNYPFQKIDEPLNVYLMSAKAMLKVYDETDDFPQFPLHLGCYLNNEITNLINLNALGETLLSIKVKNNLTDIDLMVFHDRIKEFETEFSDTIGASNSQLSLSFIDSKDDLLIQYADNVASVFRKAFTETTRIFLENKQWEKESEWFPTLLADVMRKLSSVNVKFVTAISDWVLPICVEQIFTESSQIGRNQVEFMSLFYYIKEQVLETIAKADYSVTLSD